MNPFRALHHGLHLLAGEDLEAERAEAAERELQRAEDQVRYVRGERDELRHRLEEAKATELTLLHQLRQWERD